MPALPEPQGAERQERQPRQCGRDEQDDLRPITAKQLAESHGLAPGRRAARLFAYESPASSPFAKARRTSLFGAVRPRRRKASQTQAASPMPTVTPNNEVRRAFANGLEAGLSY